MKMVDKIDTAAMFRRKYKMRAAGENGLNIVVSIPRIVLQREADKRGISLKDFIRSHHAVALFDDIDGIHYIFEKKEGGDE